MPCPSHQILEQLLSGALDDPGTITLSTHIRDCLECQRFLDQSSDHQQLRGWADSCPSWHINDSPDPELQECLVRMRQLRPAVLGPVTSTNGLGNDAVEEAADAGSYLAPPLQEGDLGSLGPHRILAELGRGGMGIVFKGRDSELSRTVAVKVLSSAKGDATARGRFVREAQALAELEHDHIVSVYSVAQTADGIPYLVMQFVDGPTLRKRIHDEGRILPFEAARIAAQVADGLAAAHRRGLVHRDIKPANIICDSTQARAKIVDFGLVRGDEPAASRATQEGTVPGTPEYMSPEQVTEPSCVDGRSDIYSLGVTLYEMLTGEPPFHGSPLPVLQRIVHDEPIPPRKSISSIPRDLETICLKSMSKKPSDRYQTALDFADELRRFLNHEPIRACAIGPWGRLQRWCRRKPALAALIAVIILSGLAITIGSFMAAVRLQESADERLWQAKYHEARAHRTSDRIGRRVLALQALRDANQIRPTPELRDEAIAALALFDLEPVKTMTMHDPSAKVLEVEDRLDRYVSLDRDGNLSIRSLTDDREACFIPGDISIPFVEFSRNGEFLAVMSRPNRLTVWNLDSATRNQTGLADKKKNSATPLVNELALAETISPDGKLLLVASPQGTIRLFDLPSGKFVREFTSSQRPLDLEFHPQKHQWVTIREKGAELRDVQTGEVIAELDLDQFIGPIAWRPDGEVLAAAGDRDIYLWNTQSRKPHLVLPGSKRGGNLVAFNHRGDLLAANGWDYVLRIWNAQTGQQLFQTPSTRCAPRFSGDDRFMATIAEKEVQIFELRRNDAYRSITDSSGLLTQAAPSDRKIHYFSPLISPAGTARGRLAAAASESGVTFWDLADSRKLGMISIGPTYGLAFEASGALWTNGPNGVRRWSAHEDPAGTVHFGPPELLLPRGNNLQLACSADGRIACLPNPGGAIVLHRDSDNSVKSIRLTPQEDVRYVSISEDGRWVATGSHNQDLVKIWDAVIGICAKELLGSGSGVQFVPGNRWLYTSGGDGQLWSVGSWKPGPARNHWQSPIHNINFVNCEFSPDGNLLAEGIGDGIIRITDVSKNRELANLQDPNRDDVEFLTFSPDGTRVLTVAAGMQVLHIWDLGALDRGLKEAGLAWQIPIVARPTQSLQPLTLRIDLGLPGLK